MATQSHGICVAVSSSNVPFTDGVVCQSQIINSLLILWWLITNNCKQCHRLCQHSLYENWSVFPSIKLFQYYLFLLTVRSLENSHITSNYMMEFWNIYMCNFTCLFAEDKFINLVFHAATYLILSLLIFLLKFFPLVMQAANKKCCMN
jgi:hypothetical protein